MKDYYRYISMHAKQKAEFHFNGKAQKSRQYFYENTQLRNEQTE